MTAAPAAPGDAHDGALRVASFNVRHGLALDGRHSWPFRRRACAAAVAAVDADVIGLQEARGFQQRYLERRLAGHAAVGAGRDDGRRRGERCSVLYRRSRLELEEWTVRWFSPTPGRPGSLGWGNRIPRIVTLCRFTDRRSGRRFGVADAHWDGASAASRLRGADALLGMLDPELPWVVAGDLNTTAGDPAVLRLLDGGLSDPLAHLGERGPRAATHHRWDGATAGTRIDFVLATAGWEVLGAAIAHDAPGGRLPSDHWPVVAVVRLRD